MLNRRHLRVKVLQSLYAYFQSDEESLILAEKEMLKSIDRIYDLYIYLLLSLPELKTIAEHRVEESKKKIRPSVEDVNPNLKFIENKIISKIEACKELRTLSEERKSNWVGDVNREMFRKIFLNLRESEHYFGFMNNGLRNYEEDVQMAITVFKNDIANSEAVYHFLEEKSIHWIDDIDLVCQMVIKTIKATEENEPLVLLSLWKDQEDELDFVRKLLRKTIELNDYNIKLIDDLTTNWEVDRIAKMDVLLLNMAITELQVCNNIPTKVTLNEYIEISKFYSTPKSNGFINGILDKAIPRLEQDKKIIKTGRGLIK